MIELAVAATFIAVLLMGLVAWWPSPKHRVSVMERIGGHGVFDMEDSDDPIRIRCARCGVVEDLNPIEDHEAWVGHPFQPVALADSEVHEWLRLHWADAP